MKSSALHVWLWLVGCAVALVIGCREVPAPVPLPTSTLPSPPATAVPSPDMTQTALPSPTAEPSWTATLPPTEAPVPEPTASVDQVGVRETAVSIPGYVYEPYLKEGFDEEHGVPSR